MNRSKYAALFAAFCITCCLYGCGTPGSGAVTPSTGPTLIPAATMTPTIMPTTVPELPATSTPTLAPTATSTPVPTSTPAPTNTPTPTPSPTVTPTPTPAVTTITCSFAGDVTLGSDLINQNSSRNFYKMYEKVQDDSYFFSNVLPYFAADDLTLVNLEGVLSARGERQDKTFAFRGAPSYVNILTEGSVEAVCMSNNHSKDYGQVSHDDTREILEQANILYSYEDLVSHTTINNINIAMISVYVRQNGIDGSKALLEQTISEAKAQDAALIITSFHWGNEGTSKLKEEQTVLAHYAIDLGSNLVLGHHPHVLQAIEHYNGAYIVYSLGNFCFGGNTNPKDKDTMIFQQTFTFTDSVLTPEESTARVIPCSVSSVTDRNDYRPTPQTGDEAERIIAKLNKYCKTYHLSFTKEAEGVYIPMFHSPSE